MRELGFPRESEKPTPDGVMQVQHFEWGAIYIDFGGNVLHGELHARWHALNRTRRGSPGPYGYPIDDQQAVAGGQAAFFERGAWWVDGDPRSSADADLVQ